MTEIIHTINVSANNFGDLETCLDKNPEFLLFTSPSGATLKVDLKQQKDVRWMNDIKSKTTNYTDYLSAAKRLGEIKSYCDAVIVAATSK